MTLETPRMILIGSRALFPRLSRLIPENQERMEKADWDIIMSPEQFQTWYQVNESYITKLYPTNESKYRATVTKPNGERASYEIELAFPGTSGAYLLEHLTQVCDGVTAGPLSEMFWLLKPEYLRITKRSHIMYPVHFEKNMSDYHLLKRMTGELVMDETMQEYYRLRYEEAVARYKQKTPNLNVTNEKFFDSKLPVPTYFVHDDIHAVMAHYEKPVYEMIKRDFSLAKCEQDMFDALPREYRIRCVQEEAYVIALERYLIPQYGDDCHNPFAAYKRAVKRICTSLCSGWFRDYAIENYPEIILAYNPGFVDIFLDAVRTGKIKPKDGVTLEEIPLLQVKPV